MSQVTPPPIDTPLFDLLSPEEREQIEKRENSPLTIPMARQILTGCFLTISHRMPSAPICVLDFRLL